MVRLIFLVLIIYFYSLFKIHSEELDKQEILFFNFLDLNNDNYISYEEINQSIILVFQLIDIDHDDKISIEEINELKNILELFK